MRRFITMHQYNKQVFSLFLLWAGLFSAAFSQLTISPYSRYGLGDVYEATNARNFAMGGVGVGTYGLTNINRINPASFADLRLTTLDLTGFVGYSAQDDGESKAEFLRGGFHNVSFAFPANKHFALVFGLSPYSATGYDIAVADSVLVDTTFQRYTTSYTADGGLNQAFLGVGFKMFKKVNVGASAGFAFGNLNRHWVNDFDDAEFATVNINRRTSLSGILYRFGVTYNDALQIDRQEDKLAQIRKENMFNLRMSQKWQREEDKLLKEQKRLERKEPEQLAKVDDLRSRAAELKAKIEKLSENERENEKDIARLQTERKKLLRKAKKTDQKISQPIKANDKAVAMAQRRQEEYDKKRELGFGKEEVLRRKILDNPSEQYNIKKEKLPFTIGAIWEPSTNLNGEKSTEINNSAVIDTVGSVYEGAVSLPVTYGIGMSIYRDNHWSLAGDLRIQNWNTFKFLDEQNEMKTSLRVNLGGEWIPGMKDNSRKYGSKIAYRAGAYYNSTALSFDDNKVNELGVTVGVGLPLMRPGIMDTPGGNVVRYPRVNIGIALGRIGTQNGGLLQENFVKLRVGINLNNKWFRKVVID